MNNEEAFEYPTQLTWLGIQSTPTLQEYAKKLEVPIAKLKIPGCHMKVTLSTNQVGRHDPMTADVLKDEVMPAGSDVVHVARVTKDEKSPCQKFSAQANFKIHRKTFICKALGDDLYAAIDELEAVMKHNISDWHSRMVQHHSKRNLEEKRLARKMPEVDEQKLEIDAVNAEVFKKNQDSFDDVNYSELPPLSKHYWVAKTHIHMTMREALHFVDVSGDELFTYHDYDQNELITLAKNDGGDFTAIHHGKREA